MKGNQLAFPLSHQNYEPELGMRFRDYIIGQIAGSYIWHDVSDADIERVARFIVRAADAVIEESNE